MTVCIAALADLGKSLVLVCDSRLSAGEVSGDRAANKMFPLSDQFQWWAMVSANDITQVPSVLDAVVHSLFRVSDSTNTAAIVERCVLEAYMAIRMRYAADLVLSPIGFTVERFLANSERHPDLKEKLSAVDLGCELLVAGFDFAGDGFIFTVEHPGDVRSHTFAGWASIGSGANEAINSLLRHSVNYTMELPRVLWHACESKFRAELSEGVGRHTVVKVADGAGKMDAYEASEALIDNIRGAWERGGAAASGWVISRLQSELERHPGLHKGDNEN